MRHALRTAPTDTTPRGLRPIRRSMLELAVLHALFVDAPAPAAAAAGGAAPAAAPAAASKPADAGAAAAPAAAGGDKPPAAAPAAAPAKADDLVIGAPAAAAAPAAASVEDQRKYLIEKGGKADEVGKLTEADLKKQYDEAKGKDAVAAAQPVKAEDIKITLPEGAVVDEKLMGEFQAVMVDTALTPQDRAQKLADMHMTALKAEVEKTYDTWRDTQKTWQGEVKADKELGGTNYDTMRSTITKAITEVGGTEAADVFTAFAFTGAANNPHIVRIMYRMAKLVTEGGPIAGGAPADAKQPTTQAAIKAMYPSATGSTPAKAA